jgi:hypothetical protein
MIGPIPALVPANYYKYHTLFVTALEDYEEKTGNVLSSVLHSHLGAANQANATHLEVLRV